MLPNCPMHITPKLNSCFQLPIRCAKKNVMGVEIRKRKCGQRLDAAKLSGGSADNENHTRPQVGQVPVVFFQVVDRDVVRPGD